MHKSGSFARACGLALPTLLLCVPVGARAAGIYVPENGSEVLSQGGVSTGLLDTAYALEFNPAGLTFGEGLDVRLGVNVISPGESFTPCANAATPGHPCTQHATTVSNTGGVSPSPTVLVSYHPPMLKWLGVGAGLFTPPGVLNYNFPDPRSYPSNANPETVAAATPQRYNLISQSTVIVYPSIAIAVRPIPWVSVGGTLSYIYSTTGLSVSEPALSPGEASAFQSVGAQNDVIANINVQGAPRLTGVFGIIIDPIPDLILSASYHPVEPVFSSGDLSITPGSEVKQIGVMVASPPNTAKLEIVLPPVLRAGASYKFLKRFSLAGEFVWEGWSTNNQFQLQNQAVVSGVPNLGGVSGNGPVGTINLLNEWRDAESYRLGFAYDIVRPEDMSGFGLKGSIGGLYETNAIPFNRQTLPFVTGTRVGLSVGVTAEFHGFGLNVGFMDYIPQTFEVSNTTVDANSPLPGSTPVPIGNGTYSVNYWVVGVGLSFHGFGG